MAFAYLGDIIIGDQVWTGPISAKEGRKATLVEHKVARGKMPLQDMGDDNDDKGLEFFFDETFCDAEAELAKLTKAFSKRTPLTYVTGDGTFDGVRWLIETLDVETLKTTPHGRPVRIKVAVTLREVPADSPLTFFAAIARAGASAISQLVGSQVGAKK